ncbi:MAG: hypothetical protein GY811_06895 [Myxococcales bacterium]|nr:hypothetical protein [Myxococcales bacterium]
MKRRQTMLAVMALGLAGACGGGEGDGESAAPVTPAQASSLCSQSCAFEAECFPDDVDAECQSDCESQIVEIYSFGAVQGFLDCSTASCDASEDACLLDIPLREVDSEYQSTCTAYLTMCED